jgi:hypothetical protein
MKSQGITSKLSERLSKGSADNAVPERNRVEMGIQSATGDARQSRIMPEK